MGNPTPENTAPPQQALQENPGFSFVVPTEFVELPSGGRYYSTGHPLHNQESIEIKQMTAKEEDLLTSRTLLKNGLAIDRVLKSIIMNKSIDTDTLLVGDRNAILIAARISGYGSEYSTNVTCPACETSQNHTFNLLDITNINENINHELDITNNNDGTFTTTLPRTRVNVTYKLLNGSDEKNMVKRLENDRKKKRIEAGVTSQIGSMVVSVNGDGSPQALNYLIDNIPSIDARHLRLCYRLTAPNVDMTQYFSCGDCGHSEQMEVPLTADFFWPDR